MTFKTTDKYFELSGSKKPNKYRNQKVVYDGITFDSKKEYHRYMELQLLEKSKEITNLKCHQEFVLIPSQKHKERNERKISYIADFVYHDKNNNLVVEDTKSDATRKDKAYIIKRKLMLYIHGICIREI